MDTIRAGPGNARESMGPRRQAGTLCYSRVSPRLTSQGLTMMKAAVLVSGCWLMACCFSANAMAQTSDYGWAFWPELDAYARLRSGLRLQFADQSRKGEDYFYRPRIGRTEVGYQLKPIIRPHERNIDEDKEHYLVVAGGYAYLETSQPGKSSHEDRGIAKIGVGPRQVPARQSDTPFCTPIKHP
jgi:hypothetical protein